MRVAMAILTLRDVQLKTQKPEFSRTNHTKIWTFGFWLGFTQTLLLEFNLQKFCGVGLDGQFNNGLSTLARG
jgi:hypothetical protein